MTNLEDDISIGRWGRFDSPAMESAYQATELRLDLERGRSFLWLVCLGAIVFFRQDWVIFGADFRLYVSLVVRLGVLVFCGLALLSLRRHVTPRKLEDWMIGLSVILSAMVLFGYSTRPLLRMNHGMNVLLIMAFAVVIPMRLSFQTIASAIFASATFLILLVKHPDSFIAVGVTMVLVLTFTLGFFTSRTFHRVRRERFAAHQSEVRIREQLESAFAEIKTLRGLLPICAACKKIRQDDDSWKHIEQYISEHTDAQFTHGICPDCRQRLYPEYPKRENI